MILGGKSDKTSSLSRRNMKGKTCLCNDSKASAPASCSLDEVLLFLAAAMGLANFSLKTFSVPKKPGMRKSKSDHNSNTLFWIGVPDNINACSAAILLTDLVNLEAEFLIICPSSRTQ